MRRRRGALVAEPIEYGRYAIGIRAEFEPTYGATAYRSGRTGLLTSVLRLVRENGLFESPALQQQSESALRNLSADLASLER